MSPSDLGRASARLFCRELAGRQGKPTISATSWRRSDQPPHCFSAPRDRRHQWHLRSHAFRLSFPEIGPGSSRVRRIRIGFGSTRSRELDELIVRHSLGRSKGATLGLGPSACRLLRSALQAFSPHAVPLPDSTHRHMIVHNSRLVRDASKSRLSTL